MSESSIFDGSTDPVVQAVPVTPTVLVPTELAEFVGEGKKYSSVDVALKSIPHAQSHISTLEQENARIKAELESRRTTEELLEDIRNGIAQPATVTSAPAFDQGSIETVIESLLTRKEQSRQEQSNVSTVINKFTEVFGDKAKAEEAFIKLANESGMSIPTLNKLAATSPLAVLKLAGMDTKQVATPSKIQSTVNTDTMQQGGTQNQSARIKMVGASTKDLKQAVQNARETVLNRYK